MVYDYHNSIFDEATTTSQISARKKLSVECFAFDIVTGNNDDGDDDEDEHKIVCGY